MDSRNKSLILPQPELLLEMKPITWSSKLHTGELDTALVTGLYEQERIGHQMGLHVSPPLRTFESAIVFGLTVIEVYLHMRLHSSTVLETYAQRQI